MRDSGQRHVETALLEIGDRSLIHVETARVDPGFLAGLEEFAASAPDIENRLLVLRALDVIVNVDVSAEGIFEPAIDEIGCRLPVVGCQYGSRDVA